MANDQINNALLRALRLPLGEKLWKPRLSPELALFCEDYALFCEDYALFCEDYALFCED